jgi:hypothetical protein
VIGLLAGVIFLLGTGACFRALTEAWLGNEPDWRESLRFALRRTPALLWVTFLYFLAVMFGLVLLIIPGIWLSIAFALCFRSSSSSGSAAPRRSDARPAWSAGAGGRRSPRSWSGSSSRASCRASPRR